MSNFNILFDNLEKVLSLIPLSQFEIDEKMKMVRDTTSRNELYQNGMPEENVAFTFEFKNHNVEPLSEKSIYNRKGRMFVDMDTNWDVEGIEIEYYMIAGRDEFVMSSKYNHEGSLIETIYKKARLSLKEITKIVSKKMKKIEEHFKLDKKVIRKMIANGFNYRSTDTDSLIEYNYDNSGFVYPSLNILTADFNYNDEIFNKEDCILHIKFDTEFNIETIKMTTYKRSDSKIFINYDTTTCEPMKCVISSKSKKFEDVTINPSGMSAKDILEYEMILVAKSMSGEIDEMFPELKFDTVVDYKSEEFRSKIEIVKMIII